MNYHKVITVCCGHQNTLFTIIEKTYMGQHHMGLVSLLKQAKNRWKECCFGYISLVLQQSTECFRIYLFPIFGAQ